jgi:hypothetical protein
MVTPCVRGLCCLFQDNVLAILLSQVVTDRESGLSPANDDGLNVFGHLCLSFRFQEFDVPVGRMSE